MFRLTVKNLAANRVRFMMTTFAVVLSVSFVVSAFVLGDGLRSTFGDLSQEIAAGTDLEVRPTSEFGDPEPLDESLLAEVEAIDGVAAAAPLVTAPDNGIRPIKPDGSEITANGPPQLMFGWVDDPSLSRFTLIDGAPPTADGEFTMDVDAAASHGFVIGGTYDVIAPTGRTELTLTGTTSFGESNDTLGATLMQAPVDTVQELTGQTGYDAIQVALTDSATSGSAKAAVQDELAALATGTEVVDNVTLAAEQQADFNEGIDLIGNIMLGFGGVALFVSIFIIYNTFAIVLGQRTRELGLLRTIGADARQIRRSVIGEALLVGLLASAIGIAAGVGLAVGLTALFNAIGASLPDSPLIVSTRTVLAAVIIGVGVTLVAALGPARKAAGVSPVDALRDGAEAGQPSGRSRLVAGLAMMALGVGVGAFGLFAAGATSSIIIALAVGAMSVFLGVTLASPVVAQPVIRVLGAPFGRTMGVAGRLAGQNAGRNPQRTSTTAAALMIGLALVSMALVVGDSVKAQLRSTLTSSVSADYMINETTSDSGFPDAMTQELEALDVTSAVADYSYDAARIGGEVHDVVGASHEATASLFDIGVTEGVAYDPDVVDPVLVSESEADATGLSVGDVVPAEFASGETRDLTVVGVFGDPVVIEEPYFLDSSTWDDVGAEPVNSWVALSLADGVTTAQAEAALAPVEARYPNGDIDTTTEFVDRLEGFIDEALVAVNVLVALAILIALLGIANTLALSVFERTRELGLLRAVGMNRRQLRRMVRLEAGLVALFGAVLGVTVGVLFGWAAVVALPESVTSTLAVPYQRILLLVAVSGLAGLVAAWGPARRAGRLNVLDAIAG